MHGAGLSTRSPPEDSLRAKREAEAAIAAAGILPQTFVQCRSSTRKSAAFAGMDFFRHVFFLFFRL